MYYGLQTSSTLPPGYQFILQSEHDGIDTQSNTIILISVPYVSAASFFDTIYKRLGQYDSLKDYVTIEVPAELWSSPIDVVLSHLCKLPSNVSILVTPTNDLRAWTKWSTMKHIHRRAPCNLAIRLSMETACIKYWRTEDILFIVISQGALTTNHRNTFVLAQPQSLLQLNAQQAPLILPPQLNLSYIRWLCKQPVSLTHDMLIDPLQPLTQDLTLGIYHQFEKDENKYNQYAAAMELAMADLATLPQVVVLFVGPGQGKLIDKFFCLEWDPQKVSIYAYEKNSKCMETLKRKNKDVWNGKVHLFQGDIRDVELPYSHLVVSELLGSFGDNELCPEILARFNEKRPLIMIPSSYTSFLQPVYSKVLASLGDVGSPLPKDIQRPYLCKVVDYYDIDEFQEVWEYEHPDTSNSSTLRSHSLKFLSLIDCSINGFYGYFTSNLYGHINITLVGSHSQEICDSWYPILFPVREVQISSSSEMEFSISRKVDDEKVWYEWDFQQEKYNTNGAYYHIGL